VTQVCARRDVHDLICLEDGKKLTMMKRYLSSRFNLTPDQYRAKWELRKDYPVVPPNYAEKRRSLAQAIGWVARSLRR
jgi:predicted transcriptional regulator